jgi:hypothetical protein
LLLLESLTLWLVDVKLVLVLVPVLLVLFDMVMLALPFGVAMVWLVVPLVGTATVWPLTVTLVLPLLVVEDTFVPPAVVLEVSLGSDVLEVGGVVVEEVLSCVVDALAGGVTGFWLVLTSLLWAATAATPAKMTVAATSKALTFLPCNNRMSRSPLNYKLALRFVSLVPPSLFACDLHHRRRYLCGSVRYLTLCSLMVKNKFCSQSSNRGSYNIFCIILMYKPQTEIAENASK